MARLGARAVRAAPLRPAGGAFDLRLPVKIGLCPVNPTIGDFDGNAERCLEAMHAALDLDPGVELLVLPELAVCGYPPRDLLFRDSFLDGCVRCAEAIASGAPRGVRVVVGLPERMGDGEGRRDPGGYPGGYPGGRPGEGRLRNALRVTLDGAVTARYAKRLLPTYDVFDEDRYFVAGLEPVLEGAEPWRVGLSLCEDLWHGEDAGVGVRYAGRGDPMAELAAAGARVVVNPSASPFVLGKQRAQAERLRSQAATHGVWIAAVNQHGANDDLIFDGGARLVRPDGALVAATRGFGAGPLVADLEEAAGASPIEDPLSSEEPERLLFDALTLGVRDYLHKTGFSRALVGLSGGIDSAVTASLAVAALGAGNVTGVMMPSRHSSSHGLEDADALARRLGIRGLRAPIEEGVDGLRSMTDPVLSRLGEPRLGAPEHDLADENLQSRVRGTLMMTLSNRTGALVLITGNKSELAVGYSTLYGDMNGALAVLSDVPKTRVYGLARWMNANAPRCGFGGPPIPERSIDKPPSAELRPGQLDSDTLPDYAVLDEVVRRFVDGREPPEAIAGAVGVGEGEAARLCALIDRNEYKRRQLAVGLKVTQTAFGPGRRVPVAWSG